MDDSKVQEPVSPELVELPFDDHIACLTKGFVGREWVFEEVDKWLRECDERFFLLSGEAGVGKSAVAARLCQIREDVVARHFCIAGSSSTIIPGSVARSIAAQLATCLPDYGLALANTVSPTLLKVDLKLYVKQAMPGSRITGVVIKNLTPVAARQEFGILLTAPLAKIARPEHPLLIVVDALDEALAFKGDDNLVSLLEGLNDLPSWVRFLVTSNPDPDVMPHFASAYQCFVRANSPANRHDLRQYVKQRLDEPALKAAIAAAPVPVTPEALLSEIAGNGEDSGLADGNFLYTRVLLEDIEAKRQPLDDLAALPRSLDAIYLRYVTRPIDDWKKQYQPVLAVLAAAREPLTLEQVAQFADASAQLVQARMSQTLANIVLRELEPILDQTGEPGHQQYSLFHHSLREYLQDVSRSGEFACLPVDGNAAIADGCLKAARNDWRSCDLYCLRHLPAHLHGARNLPRLAELLTDFDWISAKLDRLDVTALIDDYAFAESEEAGLVGSALRLSAFAVAVDKTQLPGQLAGRLSSYAHPSIKELLDAARSWTGAIWLCPLTPSLARPGGPLVRTFKGRSGGHEGTVRSLSITPDGRRAITAGNSWNDHTVRVWDLDAGMQLQVFCDEAADGYTPLAIAASGLAAFTAYEDEVRAWDLVMWQRAAVLPRTGDRISALATIDGARAIVGSASGAVRVWDVKAGSYDLGNHQEEVFAVSISEDRQLAASISGNLVKIWDMATRQECASLKVETGLRGSDHWNESQLAWLSPNGSALIFGNPPKRWDFGTNMVTDILKEAPTGDVQAISACGTRCLIKSSDYQCPPVLWDVAASRKLLELRQISPLAAAALTPDGRRAFTSDYEHNLFVWDLSGEIIDHSQTPSPPLATLQEFALEGHSAFLQLPDGTVGLYSLEVNDLAADASHVREVDAAVAAHSRNRAAVAAHVLSRLPLPARVHAETLVVAVSEDGRRAVSALAPTAKLGDYPEPKVAEISSLAGQEGPGQGQPCKDPTAAGEVDGFEDITLWDVPGKWQVLAKPVAAVLRGHTRPVLAMSITADGKTAVSGGWGQVVRIWDLEKRAQRWALAGHTGLISCVAITPDGRRAASASEDSTVRLWNLETGELSAVFSGEAWMIGCCLSPDGEVLVAEEFAGPGKIKHHILRLCGK